MRGSRETRGIPDEDDDSFRVTTTNLPFEKYPGGWKNRLGDTFARKLDDGANDGVRKSSDNSDKGGNSEDHAGTKVRFAIESSPARSSSNCDGKIDVPCNSCESILGEQSFVSSAQLTEIREEIAKVADRSDDSRDKSRALSIGEGNFAMEEDDPFTLAGATNVDAILKTTSETRCYGINYEKTRRWDSSSILSLNERVACENLRIENKANEASEERTAEHARRFADESTGTARRDEEAKRAEITERRTQGEKTFPEKFCGEDRVESERVLIGEPLESFLNDDDAAGSSRLSIDDLADKSSTLLVCRRSLTEESEKRTRGIADSKDDYEEASPSDETFVKSVPAKIRRDFFLETMLADHPLYVSMECTAISTRAVLLSPSVNGELSTPSESTDKTRELDADSKRSRAFDETIKAHTEKKKVLKDAKGMSERTDASNVDAESTKSWNKSTGESKNDVLNELLCSFGNIKLKMVSPENKRPATRVGEENNIAQPVAIDSGISAENEDASFKQHTLEERKDEACETELEPSIEIARLDDDAAITGITKEALARTKLDPASSPIDGELARSENVAIMRAVSHDAKSKSATAESDRARSRIWKTSKSEENEVSGNERENRKSRDLRSLETMLEKKNAECEEAKQFQKRIPIGPPATVNKIFDSRELETIADTSRGEKRAGVVSREAHDRVGEKTDKVMNDETEADPRRIASRPTLSLARDLSLAASSEDKCAIASGTTCVTRCNNNDNNKRAVRAVVNVSNDQSSCDIVTITPGKVRSFVKYYEIRGDATTVEGHSKINDREKVAKRKSTKKRAAPAVTRNPRRPEIMAEGVSGTNDASGRTTQLSRRTMPETRSRDNSIREEKAGSRLTRERERSASHVSGESHVPLANKSMQFRIGGGFDVILSETLDEKSAGIFHDANASAKKKASGIASSRDAREIAKPRKSPDARQDLLPRRESVAQVGEFSLKVV